MTARDKLAQMFADAAHAAVPLVGMADAFLASPELAALKRRWQAEAWDEGYRRDWTGGVKWSNPYRDGEDDRC